MRLDSSRRLGVRPPPAESPLQRRLAPGLDSECARRLRVLASASTLIERTAVLLLTSIELAARNFLLGHLRRGVRAQWPLQSGKVVRQAAECGGKSRVTAASTACQSRPLPGPVWAPLRLGAASQLASLEHLTLSSFFNGRLSLLDFFWTLGSLLSYKCDQNS